MRRLVILPVFLVAISSLFFGDLSLSAEPNEKQDAAIAYFEKLGGKVTVDEKSPGKPVIELYLFSTKVTNAGLVHLKGFTKLLKLNLGGTKVTDAGLVHLKGLAKLQVLNLNSTEVTDAGLVHLKGLANLHRLDLYYTKVADAGLVHLKGLVKLQELSLHYTKVTDAGLVHLKGLVNLQTLGLSHTKVTDLSPLEGLTNLKRLGLSNTQVRDLSPLKNLRHLKELGLSKTQVRNLSPLKFLTKLEYLDLESTQVSDLSPLKGMKNLEKLKLKSTPTRDLSPLKSLANLQELELGKTQIRDLSPLTNLLKLTKLFLEETRVGDLSPLKGLKELKWLNLEKTQVRDISPLEGLTGLEMLNLVKTPARDLSPLKNLKNLKGLGLPETRASDLSVLAVLTNLEWLHLENPKAEDFSPLAKLKNLKELHLENPIAEDLSPLAKLKNLEELSLVGEHIKEREIRKLEKALPNCMIKLEDRYLTKKSQTETGQKEKLHPVEKTLLVAREVVRKRMDLINENIELVHKIVEAGPEGVAHYRKKTIASLEKEIKAAKDEKSKQFLALALWSVTESNYEKFLSHRIWSLVRLQAVEAARIGLDHVDLSTSARPRNRKPGEELLKRIGRSGSALIIDHLRSKPDLPPEKRKRLMDLLRQIEGPAAEVLLANPPPLPPAWKRPKRLTKGLKIRFFQMPALRNPEYQGHDIKSVLKFAEGKVVEGPVLGETRDDEDAYEEAYNDLIEKTGKAGDLAFFVDKGISMIIPTHRFAKLDAQDLYDYSKKDLSKVYLPKRWASTGACRKGQIFLIQTRQKKYVLLQYLGHFQDEALLCYVYQPDGTSKFPIVWETSEFEPGQLYGLRVNRFWGRYRYVYRDLVKILDGTNKEASLEQKAKALRLISQLGGYGTVPLIIAHLKTSFPGVKNMADHPAVKALANITPPPRLSLLDLIKKEKSEDHRKFLVDCLMHIEGKHAGKALLKSIK